MIVTNNCTAVHALSTFVKLIDESLKVKYKIGENKINGEIYCICTYKTYITEVC